MRRRILHLALSCVVLTCVVGAGLSTVLAQQQRDPNQCDDVFRRRQCPDGMVH